MSEFSRRQFLQLSVISGAGLILGLRTAAGADSVTLHPLIQISQVFGVVLFAQNPELGQGVKTSLPMILAEELDVRFEDVKVGQADWLPGEDLQFSGGSLSVRLNYQAMRQAGATARRMLMQAAADRWQVPLERLSTDAGFVVDQAGSRRAAYVELAAAAASLPVPDDVTLKDPDDFKVIGRSASDVDLPAIVTGWPFEYSLDFTLPDMLYAVVRRSPWSDGQVASFSATAARAIPGVHSVVPLANTEHGGRVILPNSPNFVSGVAVLADGTWSAMQGARALEVQWHQPPDVDDTEALYAKFRAGLDGPAQEVRRDGEPERLLSEHAELFDAVYEVPLLAHAPMEPMNCTARYIHGRLELWAPTQNPGGLVEALGKALGIDSQKVRVHVLRSGGAFGRRYYSDFAVEAALLARQAGRPVKVVWSREDDIRHDYFRPAGAHRIRARLDSQKSIAAWRHTLAGHSRSAYLERSGPPWGTELDEYTFPAGLVPNLLLEHVHVPSRIPLGQWRGVTATATVFVVSSALDELAHRAGEDPAEFLLRLLGQRDSVPVTERFSLDTRRLREVLHAALEAAGWKQPLAPAEPGVRRGRGVAACYDQGAWVAEVAEVSVKGRKLKVDRIVAAVDCGRVINPQGAHAQVEGAILDGLGAALMGEVTIKAGQVEQDNFDGYPLLRMAQAPMLDIHFVASEEDPRGLGEPPLPPVAPAVCNAIFAATGQRVRRLPLKLAFEV